MTFKSKYKFAFKTKVINYGARITYILAINSLILHLTN